MSSGAKGNRDSRTRQNIAATKPTSRDVKPTSAKRVEKREPHEGDNNAASRTRVSKTDKTHPRGAQPVATRSKRDDLADPRLTTPKPAKAATQKTYLDGIFDLVSSATSEVAGSGATTEDSNQVQPSRGTSKPASKVVPSSNRVSAAVPSKIKQAPQNAQESRQASNSKPAPQRKNEPSKNTAKNARRVVEYESQQSDTEEVEEVEDQVHYYEEDEEAFDETESGAEYDEQSDDGDENDEDEDDEERNDGTYDEVLDKLDSLSKRQDGVTDLLGEFFKLQGSLEKNRQRDHAALLAELKSIAQAVSALQVSIQELQVEENGIEPDDDIASIHDLNGRFGAVGTAPNSSASSQPQQHASSVSGSIVR